MLCPHCNNEISDESSFCNYCGYNLADHANYKATHGSKSLKIILTSLIATILIGSTIYFFKSHQNKQYDTSIKATASLLQKEIITCLSLCEEVSDVWHKAIQNSEDINSTLRLLQSKNRSLDVYANLEKSKTELESKVSQLKNPPKNYLDSYDTILKLYSIYTDIYSDARNPTGSYLTYTQNVNRQAKEALSLIEKIKVIMPGSTG